MIKKINNDSIYAERLRLIVEALPLSIFVIIANGTLLAGIQLAVINSEIIAYWYASLLLVSALSYYWRHRYLQIKPEQRAPVFWNKRFYFGTVLSGISVMCA